MRREGWEEEGRRTELIGGTHPAGLGDEEDEGDPGEDAGAGGDVVDEAPGQTGDDDGTVRDVSESQVREDVRHT
jgi:hypothetical protein